MTPGAPPAARRGWSRAARFALTLTATGAVLGVLVADLGGSAFWVALREARPGWVALAFAVSCACVVIGAERWRLLLRAMGHPLSLARAVYVVLATWPPAVIVPSRASDLLRAVALRGVVPMPAALASVVVEKVIDLSLLLALAAAGAAVRGFWGWGLVIALGLGLEVGALAVLSRGSSRVRSIRWLRPEVVDALAASARTVARARRELVPVAIASIVVRLLTVGVTQALLVAAGAEVSPIDTLTLWPAAVLVGILPLTLGGMGTRDAAFIYLLQARGHVTRGAVLAATMGYSAVAVWSFAFIGLPMMIREMAHGGRA
ncbi:MAG TPA: lysylphosphatidylglycerol synthase transmembrane domain-containing protein [Polyangiaceae bacterium]|nr:lysylphosphatidylglycerol synthase transmembrane domain-containing protein [Polyangiaceae bacterium]